MTLPAASVIVVSRDRPDDLALCLTALGQLDHPAFEIVLVADRAGLAAADRLGLADRIKCAAFETPNISAARNAGLALAAGEIVAFIDDDAVPEPTWLSRLCAPFADGSVSAAVGYVRGRNGVSFQSRGARVDAAGRETPLELPGPDPVVLDQRPGDAVKTEGTNCAFRRDVLVGIGGFDPAFHYYLDETDVNLRLAAQCTRTAVVPLAEVHHAAAPSARRRSGRVPRSLFDIGASTAVFLRKHLGDAGPAAHRAALFTEQRRRLLRHMVAGTCEPGEVAPLLATLAAGWDEGLQRPLSPLPPVGAPPPRFLPYRALPPLSGMAVLAGRIWSLGALRQEARGLVAQGRRVSVFVFSPTSFYHRVSFTTDGVWEQRGGLFGRSDRDAPLMRPERFRGRLATEIARVAPQRGLTTDPVEGR